MKFPKEAWDKNTHIHTHTHRDIYIYIYIYICVCVCVYIPPAKACESASVAGFGPYTWSSCEQRKGDTS